MSQAEVYRSLSVKCTSVCVEMFTFLMGISFSFWAEPLCHSIRDGGVVPLFLEWHDTLLCEWVRVGMEAPDHLCLFLPEEHLHSTKWLEGKVKWWGYGVLSLPCLEFLQQRAREMRSPDSLPLPGWNRSHRLWTGRNHLAENRVLR